MNLMIFESPIPMPKRDEVFSLTMSNSSPPADDIAAAAHLDEYADAANESSKSAFTHLLTSLIK